MQSKPKHWLYCSLTVIQIIWTILFVGGLLYLGFSTFFD